MPELRQFGENIWVIEGPKVRDMGVWFTTRMTVVKFSGDALWVDSPVFVPPDTLERITALGRIRYLVAATPRHVWRLAEWHRLFPEAELWVTRTTPMTLRKGHLPFAGILGDTPPAGWSADLEQLPFRGNRLIEEIIFFHRRSRTVIVDDLIQSHPAVKGKILRNTLFRLAGVRPPGGVPLDIRLSFTNRRLARESLHKLLSWDFDQMILAHGPCIRSGAKRVVTEAFRWLAQS